MSTLEERAREHADRCAEARHHHRGGSLGAYCEQDFRAGWEAAVEAAPPLAPALPTSPGDLWRRCQAELNDPRSTRSQDALLKGLVEEAFAAGVVEAVHLRQREGSLPGSAAVAAEVDLQRITKELRELVSRYSSATLKSDELTVEDCLGRLDDILCNMVADLDSNEADDDIDPEDPSLRDDDGGDLEEELPEGAVIVPDELRVELAAFCSRRAAERMDKATDLSRASVASGAETKRAGDVARAWSRLALALLGED